MNYFFINFFEFSKRPDINERIVLNRKSVLDFKTTVKIKTAEPHPFYQIK